jgi:hypothetical protein
MKRYAFFFLALFAIDLQCSLRRRTPRADPMAASLPDVSGISMLAYPGKALYPA